MLLCYTKVKDKEDKSQFLTQLKQIINDFNKDFDTAAIAFEKTNKTKGVLAKPDDNFAKLISKLITLYEKVISKKAEEVEEEDSTASNELRDHIEGKPFS